MKEKFSFKSINDFDKHISDSICHYDLLHKSIKNISTYFLRDNSSYIDLGCTTGSLIEEIKSVNKNINCIGIDIEDSNLDYNEFTYYNYDISNYDWGYQIPHPVDLFTSIFTLQFIEPQYRKRILENIYNRLSIGGALILCEKIYQESGIFQEVFNFAHYDYKREKFTYDEILNKQKDLRKIMFPLSENENINHLKDVGFTKIEPFFQSLNFKGWIAIK